MVLLLSEAAGFTLTLPGIAGLIIAVGITADSFIIFFERIRDEMREGKSMRVAVESGWVRARNTRLAADAVSLLSAVVLYIFATGAVKGFGFALGLSTLIDLAVLFWFTKPMVSWLARFKFFNRGHRLSGLSADTLGIDSINGRRRDRGREGLMGKFSRLGNDLYNGQKSIDFVGRTLALVRHLRRARPALAIARLIVVKGLNFGIEFTGGTAVHGHRCPPTRPTRTPPTSCARRSPTPASTTRRAPVVTTAGQRRASSSRPSRSPTDESDASRSDHRRTSPASTAEQTSPRTRSAPSWGEEVAERAAARPRGLPRRSWCSSSGRYFREWKMSVGRARRAGPRRRRSPIGVYALSGFQVTPAAVTGLLAILGFSLYDTVVVFDKIKENTNEPAPDARRPTPTRPTSPSTRPWSARSTPASWR